MTFFSYLRPISKVCYSSLCRGVYMVYRCWLWNLCNLGDHKLRVPQQSALRESTNTNYNYTLFKFVNQGKNKLMWPLLSQVTQLQKGWKRLFAKNSYRIILTLPIYTGLFVAWLVLIWSMIDTSNGDKLVSSGPCVDMWKCVGALKSNGRIFYTSQGTSLQVSQVCAGDLKTQ